MKRPSTDKLLTLGMALHADKRTLEGRVRGVFARGRSAGFARALTLLFCLVMGLVCFTTACMPATEASIAPADTPSPTALPAEAPPAPAEEAQPAAEAFAVDAPRPPADPIGSFIAGLTPAPFRPVTAPTRVIRNPEPLCEGVTLTYDAEVRIPEATAYTVSRMAYGSFSDEEQARLRKLFDMPENAASEELYNIDEHNFYYTRWGSVTRETWTRYELDWTPETIALFDEPCPLTRAETQPIAEKALADMGAAGYVLEAADVSIMFGAGDTVHSRGWDYAFVPESDGLPRHHYGGGFGSERDPVFYYAAMQEYIWIYVDEQGVSRVSWHFGVPEERETVAENVALLPLDEMIARAGERFSRMYGHLSGRGQYDIRVQQIRLAAMLLANSRDADEAYSVPVWEFEYSIAHEGAYRELCVLAFNAVDGNAIEACSFPF